MKLTILILFSLCFIACSEKPEQIHPSVENITESVYASGVIKSLNQHQVFPRVNGIISSIEVTEGDTLKKGDVIMIISGETQELVTENSRLAAQNADYSANANRIEEMDIAIDLAKKKLQNDSTLYERQKNLWSQQIGSQFDVEQRELAWRTSKREYESAIIKRDNLQRDLSYSSRSSKKNLEINEILQSDYTVRALFDGKIFSLLREEGEIVSPFNAVAVMGHAVNFYLELQVDENDIVRITPGKKVAVQLESYGDTVFMATVSKIQPLMNERTRTFTVEAVFDIQPPLLYPNLTVETNIIIDNRDNVITIPRNYLVEDSFVLNTENQKIRVKTGLMDLQKVEIVEGLEAGDLISKPGK